MDKREKQLTIWNNDSPIRDLWDTICAMNTLFIGLFLVQILLHADNLHNHSCTLKLNSLCKSNEIQAF